MEATLDLARFQSPEARAIAKIGLANYFAGAALMPYQEFLETARMERHDLERLSSHFGVSIEQVAHRLSTLQRPGNNGIPFFFVRVDQAGTITKRHSATRLQFARFGGGMPTLECAPCLRNSRAVFTTTCRNTRWHSIPIHCTGRDQRGRFVQCAFAQVCNCLGLRGETRRTVGLCRRA